MIIAGTGHRPDKLGGYHIELYRKLVIFATDMLKDLRPTEVITGGALGWDTALASAAKLAGIPYTVAIPCEGQDRKWPQDAKNRYAAMLALAAKRVYVPGGPYAPVKMQIRNEWMVNNSDMVLALWNGSRGGTYNCLQYADSVGKPVLNVWHKWAER